MKKTTKKMGKVGNGKRFKALEGKLEKKGISKKEAGALAAKKGREKYGNKKMAAMAAKGKKRAAKKK